MITTKTEQTEIAYIKRAELLIDQYSYECKVPDYHEFEPLGVVKWAIHKRKFLLPATWRQYRCSLVFKFEKLRDTGRDDPKEFDEAIRLLKDAGCEACARSKDAPKRTSSFKKRSITNEELQSIVSYLNEHKTRWSFQTMLWIQAAVLTGLRPMEWQSTCMQQMPDTGEFTLKLINAKQSNGRSNGENRTLHLGAMSPSDLKIIATHIQIVNLVVSQNRWELYYRECRNTLYRTTRALWPKLTSYPTIYSGRHQFAANGKKAGLSKSEVAALLGHGSVETAGFHYGKKRSGVGGMTVTPSEGDVGRLTKSLPNVLKNNGR